MKILVSNDDGIRAPGLWALAKELSEVAEVTVVAPDREQSGVGTSVTFHGPIRVKEETSGVSGIKAYSVEGTPADGIILALSLPLIDGELDLIVSGINEGANLGDDVFISGTVGAALQGYFHGIPSIAVSVGAFDGVVFGPAARLAKLMALHLMESPLPDRVLLNVNLPNVSLDRIRDMRVTRLADRAYSDGIEEGHGGRRNYYWIVRGESQWHYKEGTDHWALERDMVSVTPLLGNSVRSMGPFVKGMVADVFHELRSSFEEERKD